MKLIIAGGRDIDVSDEEIDAMLLLSGITPTTIISGAASGVDLCGERWAKLNFVPIIQFPPQYHLFPDRPKYAPIARNKAMAEAGDALLLIWNGKSPGSNSMRNEMKHLKKPIYEFKLK